MNDSEETTARICEALARKIADQLVAEAQHFAEVEKQPTMAIIMTTLDLLVPQLIERIFLVPQWKRAAEQHSRNVLKHTRLVARGEITAANKSGKP